MSYNEAAELHIYLEERLRPTWDWLLTVMDATEAQLRLGYSLFIYFIFNLINHLIMFLIIILLYRFGASLTHASDPQHPGHPLHQTAAAAALGAGVGGLPPPLPGFLGSAALSLSVLGGAGGNSASRGAGARNAVAAAAAAASAPNSVAAHAAAAASTRIVGFVDAPRTSRGGGGGGGASGGSDEPHSARRELLSYCLSLMRAHNAEHLDSLPVIDVSALRHVAYVFDALIYYMRSGQETTAELEANAPTVWPDQDENDNEDNDEDLHVPMEMESLDETETPLVTSTPTPASGAATSGRKNPFLQRSESTLCLGCPPPDPFELPMAEALPLADQPQLLQPNARREELFGFPRPPTAAPASPLETLPTRLSLSVRAAPSSTPWLERVVFREMATAHEPMDTMDGPQASILLLLLHYEVLFYFELIYYLFYFLFLGPFSNIGFANWTT